MKTLILTGDDFGRSPAVTAAVERLHVAGVLTQASLMVNEPHVAEAVAVAQRHPKLCVGLHLTLCAGAASQVSALTDATGNFEPSPARAGLRYFLNRSLAPVLQAEIRRQFEKFRALGFPPTYWDGHTHLHLHPTILRLTLPIAQEFGFQATRLVRARSSWNVFDFIFAALSAQATPTLRRSEITTTDFVFGLRESGRMTNAALQHLIEELPAGRSEIYYHPGAEPEEIDPSPIIRLLQEKQVALQTSVGDSTIRADATPRQNAG